MLKFPNNYVLQSQKIILNLANSANPDEVPNTLEFSCLHSVYDTFKQIAYCSAKVFY